MSKNSSPLNFELWALNFMITLPEGNVQSSIFNVQCEPWRITDSNRWPPACKAGALASWANPPLRENFQLSIFNYQLSIAEVVPGRLELPTSTLSVWRSNQLSYRTLFGQRGCLCPASYILYSNINISSKKQRASNPNNADQPDFQLSIVNYQLSIK